MATILKVALRMGQESSGRKSSPRISGEVSPDSKCPICLDAFHNVSHLNHCLHKFCFRCILEWSKNKAECPLCKQPFSSIYHSIKSDEEFQKYELKQHVDNSSFGYFEGVRFRYRTTLTNFQREYERIALPPPDNGVMFESSRASFQEHQDRYFRRMMTRLAAKRRAAMEGREEANFREQEMINFRRELYRRGLRIRNVRDGGRIRDTSAAFYRTNPACLHRLIPWLKRELVVLYGGHCSLANIVQHIIMARITCSDMEDEAILRELRPFLHGRTEHFLHEFISFAKSPFNMEAYDHHAVYDCPAPSYDQGDTSDSSVIAISEDEVETDHRRQANSPLSLSLWDDETPGPSYSTEERQGRAWSVENHVSDSSSDEETSDSDFLSSRRPTSVARVASESPVLASSDSEDCMIVGFTKPTAERTPELVLLSSDSDEPIRENISKPHSFNQHIRFTSCSPPVSYSSTSGQAGHSNAESNHLCPLSLAEHSNHSLSSRHLPSKNTHSNNVFLDRHRSNDRDLHEKKRKSRRRDRRSQGASHHSIRPRSTERGFPSYRRRFSPNHNRSYERGDGGHSYQSYNRFEREKNDRVARYSQRQSYYYSNPRYSDFFSCSRSGSRDSQRRDGGRSRSRTYSSSRSRDSRRRDGGRSRSRTYSNSHSRDSRKRDGGRSRSRTYSSSHSRDSRKRDGGRSRSRTYSNSHSRNSRRRDGGRSRSRTYSSSRSSSVKREFYKDKPGGKRKYKTRHLEQPSTERHSDRAGDLTSSSKHKKKSKEKRRKKSRERQRKTSGSVDRACSRERSKRHHKKKKHKKKSKRHKSDEYKERWSSSVIVIDSNSNSPQKDGQNNNKNTWPQQSDKEPRQLLPGLERHS